MSKLQTNTALLLACGVVWSLASVARSQGPAATPARAPFTPLPIIPPLATPSVRPVATPATSPAARPAFALPPATPAAAPGLPFAKVTPVALSSPPSREIPLVERKFTDLSSQEISKDGQLALGINPTKWRHAETDNFIVHYRRATEAQKVVREVEYDLWFVATTLQATKDRYQKKSHVYVFEDEAEWKDFLSQSDNPMKWAVSYAHGDELFLNIRGGGNSGSSTSFDSHTLAHETTHAVVSRLYRRRRWPLWLNEGFAEYMGGASVAARKGQSGKRFERDLRGADLPLDKLSELTAYPTNEAQIRQLYETSEKFIRFLMTELPKDRIVAYIDAVLGGQSLKDALLSTYHDKVKDWDDFQKKYAKFSR